MATDRKKVIDEIARTEQLIVDVRAGKQARRMVDALGPGDRGNLMEVWYQARYAAGSKAHQKHEVTRTSGDNEGKVETRVADLVVGREAREIKDVTGTIDKDQFEAYVDTLKQRTKSEGAPFDKLRYVFTKPEGAMANLEYLATAFEKFGLDGKLTIEVFDKSGRRHTANSNEQATELLNILRGK